MPFYPTRCRHSQAKNKSWAGSSGFWFTGQVPAATVTSLGSDLRNEIEDASSRRVRGLSLRDRLRSSEQSCRYATSKGCSLGYSASDKDETPICETSFCRDDVSLLAFQNSWKEAGLPAINLWSSLVPSPPSTPTGCSGWPPLPEPGSARGFSFPLSPRAC